MSDWLSGAAAGAGSAGVVGFVRWMFARAKQDGVQESTGTSLQTQLRQLGHEMREAVVELRSVSSETAKLQASQNVVNTVTSKAIEGIVIAQDRIREQVADHGATLRLLTENVTLLRQRIDTHVDEKQ